MTFVYSQRLMELSVAAREARDGLDVVRLGEHIKGGDGVKRVAARDEFAQVARERRGVAGDVDDAAGAQVKYPFDRAVLRAGAGRIEQEEIDGREFGGASCEPRADRGGLDARVREPRVGEVAARVSGRRRVRLDAGDAREAAREREREETDAAVEIDRRTVVPAFDVRAVANVLQSLAGERVEQRVVDLEEAGGVEAVTLASDLARALSCVLFRERRVERDAVVARDRLELARRLGVRCALDDRRAQARERLLQFGDDDGTLRHVYDAVRGELVVTEMIVARVVLPARARAVAPNVGRGRDRNLGGRIDARDASQAVAYDLDLRGELRFVIQLLEVAAAAATEVGAGRLDALAPRRDDLLERGERDATLDALDPHAQHVADSRERDEDGEPARVRHPRAARHDALDGDFQHVARLRARLFGVSGRGSISLLVGHSLQR
jgi:hypothetical protein